MSGLDTLMQEGLDITVVEGWPPIGESRAAQAELLEWHSTAGGHLPDADITVLMWLAYEDGTADWHSGYWDGEQWVDCTGMPVHESATVTHWTEPEGPAAA